MAENSTMKHDVIIAGIGGTGSMIIGQILASAGMSQYKNVLWNPSMTMARRGAPADCTVILSNEEIASPLLFSAETVIMTESSRLKAFENRANTGGLIVLETSGLKDDVERADVKVLKIPGVETALQLGEALARNMVLFGAYIAMVNPVPVELIETEMNNRFSKVPKLHAINLNAFREGLKLGGKGSS